MVRGNARSDKARGLCQPVEGQAPADAELLKVSLHMTATTHPPPASKLSNRTPHSARPETQTNVGSKLAKATLTGRVQL